jgi:YVTN family beta-propeller protein
LYVANQGSNNVSVINLSDNTVTTTIGVGSEPSALAISADNKFVYVVNRGSGNVSVIDTATDAVTNTVTVGSNPNFAVFELKQLRVYVTNSGGNSISSINADRNSASFLSVTNIPVGNAPLSLTALADGSRIYVANSGSNSISIVSALSSTVQQTIVVDPLKPVSLRSSPDGTKVVVAAQDTVAPSATHADASAIISIRASDNTITATIPAPSTPCPSGSGFLGCRMKPIFVAVTP